METIDEQLVRASPHQVFEVVRHVEEWPAHLSHYRYVRVREPASDGGGLVEMSAYRPFGPVGWPTLLLSEMEVDHATPAIRFRHVGGITRGMDVEWRFTPADGGTHVRIVHAWNKTGRLNEGNPYVHIECLQYNYPIDGFTTPIPPGTTIEYIVPDIYGRPWAQIWERYHEKGMDRPQRPGLFGFD